MKQGLAVRVRKVAATADPRVATAEWDNYIPGQDNGMISPPVEYEVAGVCVVDIQEEGFIYLDRFERNGEKVGGFFRSSRIQKITPDGGCYQVATHNSVYLVKPLDE